MRMHVFMLRFAAWLAALAGVAVAQGPPQLPSNVSATDVKRFSMHMTSMYLSRPDPKCATWAIQQVKWQALNLPTPVCDPKHAFWDLFFPEVPYACIVRSSDAEVVYTWQYQQGNTLTDGEIRDAMQACIYDNVDANKLVLHETDQTIFINKTLGHVLASVGFTWPVDWDGQSDIFPSNISCPEFSPVPIERDAIIMTAVAVGNVFDYNTPDADLTPLPLTGIVPTATFSTFVNERFYKIDAYEDIIPNVGDNQTEFVTRRAYVGNRSDGTLCQAAVLKSSLDIVTFDARRPEGLAGSAAPVQTEFYLTLHWPVDELAILSRFGNITTTPAFLVPASDSKERPINNTISIIPAANTTKKASYVDAVIVTVNGCVDTQVDAYMSNTSIPLSDAYLRVARCIGGAASSSPSANNDDLDTTTIIIIACSVGGGGLLLAGGLLAVALYVRQKQNMGGGRNPRLFIRHRIFRSALKL